VNTIILPKNRENTRRAALFLESLPRNKAWSVEVREHKPRRTDQQNRYLRACYRIVLEKGGEDFGGWTADDLHDFLLGEHFGLEHLKVAGRTHTRPARRSSRLNKQDMSDYIAFVQQWAAELGIYIPDPEEYLAP
jgi:hypothetical protein